MSGAQPVEHRFAGPAGEICWFEWGQAGQRPSLLLLHATGFHARCWDQVVAALPPGTHVIAPDLRGHGRSFRPASIGNWSDVADDVATLVGSLPAGSLIAVGHSMGGFVAALVAARLPGRFSSLLLVDPVLMPPNYYGAEAEGAEPDPADHPVSRRRNAWESADQMIARFADRPPYDSWKPEVLADYCRYGLVPAQGGGLELACPPYLEASAYLGSAGRDIYPLIAKIDCPVTVLRARNGERASALDFSISPTWPDLAQHFRRGRDVHWTDLSHFIPMEAPERLAALIVEHLAGQQG